VTATRGTAEAAAADPATWRYKPKALASEPGKTLTNRANFRSAVGATAAITCVGARSCRVKPYALDSTRSPTLDRHRRLRALEVLRHERDEFLVRPVLDRRCFDLSHPAAIGQLGECGSPCIGFDLNEENHPGHAPACGDQSIPWNAPPCTATTAAPLGARVLLPRLPGSPQPLLDITADQPAHHLRGRQVLLGTKPLEHRFLPWIDEDRQARGALFNPHYLLGPHIGINHIQD
jgi:hypothetical protein